MALPAGIPAGDSEEDYCRSTLQLFEDGVELGPGHAVHADIRATGGGTFSHWGRTLFFSTSDGSDPRRNGRVYTVAGHGGAAIAGEAGGAIAGYELSLAETYLHLMRGRGIDPVGTRVLEIGPGRNLGAPVLLACAGAQVTVADRYLSSWRPDHADVFRALVAVWPGNVGPIKAVLAGESFDGQIRSVAEPADAMISVASANFDVVLSNAVLEHVGDLAKVAAELKRVSAPGAWHFHQIDFRNHYDMTRPLEHMLLPRDDFHQALERDWMLGCQMRLSEARETFRLAGFTLVEEVVNDRASADYLADVLDRLRTSASAYRDWPADDLAVLGARLVLRA